MIEKTFTEDLIRWYQREKRILPWRDQDNAYYTWISEIMLQQTRVEAVKPYFQRFITELPDIQSLAEAQEDILLKLWEGLGYYNRVRNMQKAAREVMREYQGTLPADYDELQKLSGIGSYTAGAIASIAYHIPAPAVDGNVLRVFSRITEDGEDILKQSMKRKIEDVVMELMPENEPGDFNQALMELGAMVCLPNGAPKCEDCPVREHCMARKHQTISLYPYKAPKKQRKLEKRTVLLIQDGNLTSLRKRGEKGLLANLYEFPNLEGHLTEEEVLEYVKKLEMEPLYIEKLGNAKHIFSHIEWHMIGYRVRISSFHGFGGYDADQAEEPLFFADKREAEESIAIPSAFRAYRDEIYK